MNLSKLSPNEFLDKLNNLFKLYTESNSTSFNDTFIESYNDSTESKIKYLTATEFLERVQNIVNRYMSEGLKKYMDPKEGMSNFNLSSIDSSKIQEILERMPKNQPIVKALNSMIDIHQDKSDAVKEQQIDLLTKLASYINSSDTFDKEHDKKLAFYTKSNSDFSKDKEELIEKMKGQKDKLKTAMAKFIKAYAQAGCTDARTANRVFDIIGAINQIDEHRSAAKVEERIKSL